MNAGVRRGALVCTALAVVTFPLPAAAHGLGGRQDLPVPVGYFVAGAAVVLVVSFVALAVLWHQPRWQGHLTTRPITGRWVGAASAVGGTLGLISLLTVMITGLFGVDNPARNPAPVIVFVVFWLVVPFASAVVGDLYPLVDPWRRLAAWIGLGRSQQSQHADRPEPSYWPAVVAFIAFTFLELVAPDAGPRNLMIAAVAYTGYLLVAADATSPGWSLRFDGFAVYNRLIGAIGPLDMTGDEPRWRGWLRGLTAIPERPGLVAMVVAMIGTVTYDGASATVWWEETIGAFFARALTDGYGLSRTVTDLIAGTFGLLGIAALIGLGYLAASSLAARLGHAGITGSQVATRFAHSLVPIALAYAFAHYFTLVVFEGQYLISSISDPLGAGWDLFGTADRRIDYTLISPTAVWWIQVAAIVGGHVAGVVLAHDRALADFPKQTAVKSQYAMLGLMVALTGLGLVILSAG